MVVELRGGTVVTIIGGKRVKRRPAEFWTVPAASSMALETEDDSAAISDDRAPGVDAALS